MDELIKKIEKKGYIVEIKKRGISLYEPFISKVTGKQYNREFAFTTNKNDLKFIEEACSTLEI